MTCQTRPAITSGAASCRAIAKQSPVACATLSAASPTGSQTPGRNSR